MDRHQVITALLGTIILLAPELGYLEDQGVGTIPSANQMGGDPQDDQRLTSNLEEKLRMDQRINWQVLQVDVKNGQVKLHGVVKTSKEKGLATQIVMSQPGVHAVNNTILVQENGPETEKKPELMEKDGQLILEGEGQIKEKQILP